MVFVVIVHSAGGSNPTVSSGLECVSDLTGAVMISVVVAALTCSYPNYLVVNLMITFNLKF